MNWCSTARFWQLCCAHSSWLARCTVSWTAAVFSLGLGLGWRIQCKCRHGVGEWEQVKSVTDTAWPLALQHGTHGLQDRVHLYSTLAHHDCMQDAWKRLSWAEAESAAVYSSMAHLNWTTTPSRTTKIWRKTEFIYFIKIALQRVKKHWHAR